jgi:parvulin-like peptidyl-prolyl isomerase
LFVFLGAGFAAEVKVETIEEIIAKVNGDIITRSEIEKSRSELLAALRKQGLTGLDLDEAFRERSKDILRDRIDQLLLIQKGKEIGINVDTDISRQLAEIQRQAAKGDPSLVDPEKFAQYVRANTGMPIEDYKAEMRNGMISQRVVRQEVGGRINIPREEVKKYYEDHKTEFTREERVFLREILVSTENKDAAGVAAADKKARDLVARARKGEKFNELARDNSDAQSADEEGFIGAFKKGDLRKEVEDLVWDKPRNTVTDPIKLPNGFLILKVEETHKAGVATFEEVENEIMEKLYMPRFQPKIREYLTMLRQDGFIEIKDGWVDTSAAPGKNTAWTDPAQLRPETVTKEEVAAQPRRKRLLFIPIPGTSAVPKSNK